MSTAPMPNRWILVIDDNPAICDDFRKVLQRNARTSSLLAARAALFEDPPLDEALEATAYRSGDLATARAQLEESLRLFQAQGDVPFASMVLSALQRGCPYAVAFVDMLMPPGWDGLETIDHLWSVDPELEIVICTAFTDLARDRFPQRLEHSDKLLILRKPFDNIEVWQLASVLTQKWYLAQQVKHQLPALTDMLEQRTQELQDVRERLQAAMTQRHADAQ